VTRFNAEGISGLGMREGAGRKPRLSEQERSRILALVKQPPPGHLERYADETLEARDEEGSAQWSLDALTEAAHAAGIQVARELRSDAFTSVKACAGAVPTVGGAAMTRTLSQKDSGRHPLHRATRRVDDHLRLPNSDR
jgi:hypothetical protein